MFVNPNKLGCSIVHEKDRKDYKLEFYKAKPQVILKMWTNVWQTFLFQKKS